jgi:histidinol dehydrogenase
LKNLISRIATQGEGKRALSKVLARGRDQEAGQVRSRVSEIISSVRENGDRALLTWARSLDGFRGEARDIELDRSLAEKAWKGLDRPVREALLFARDRVAAYHRRLREELRDRAPSREMAGFRWTPIDRAAVYVPGGTALYPSTVLMTVPVARVAGVREVVVITPGGPDGIAPVVLAACHVADVDRIYQVGGVHAIAALAFGTETLPAVDQIVGPGNRYVAEAKRQLFGTIAIDMIAGPTEVLIVADATANPAFVAADLLAQAEHDPQASAVLLTDSESLAQRVAGELERQIETLPRKEIARQSLASFGAILLLSSLDLAPVLVDLLAPEHLELAVDNPGDLAARVRNAGAIFLGSGVPEAAGDYCFGPSHVLPTNGTARFSSPVSVETFMKRTSLIGGSAFDERDRILEVSEILARAEGLEGHARSAALRRTGTRP